jgi:hypothetical protein
MSFSELSKVKHSLSSPPTLKILYTKIHVHEPIFDNDACQSREWLIVASVDSVVSTGCVVLEYWSKLDNEKSQKRHVLYLEKLDSTGLSKSLGRSLALSILKILCREGTEVFVYARPQPEYLFPNSSVNEKKEVLGEKELTAFWMKTLSLIPHSRKIYFIPDASSETMKSTFRLAQSSEGWTWGYFAPTTKPAHEVLPKFPDDAKARLLKEYSDMNVGEFWQVAALSGDVKRAGFLYLVSSCNSTFEVEDGVDRDDFTRVRTLLDSLSFSEADAVVSTIKLNEMMDSLNSTTIRVESGDASVENRRVGVESSEPKVNVIQGLIKRKAVTSSCESEKKQRIG